MRKLLHQTPSRGDQPQSIFEGEDASQARRDKFADAVPDHKVRLNAPAHPQLRQRVFNRENRRLHQDGLRHLVPQLVRDCFGWIEQFAQIQSEVWLEQLRATIDFLAKYFLCLV